MNITLRLLNNEFVICKLKDANVDFADKQNFSFSRMGDEITLVCEKKDIPDNCVETEAGFCAFKVVGKLELSLVGIIAGITNTLAKKGISIFAISTFDTDYVLVKNKNASLAISALVEEGFSVVQ